MITNFQGSHEAKGFNQKQYLKAKKGKTTKDAGNQKDKSTN